MVSPLSTCPPGELTNTSIGASPSLARASKRPVTSRANLSLIAPKDQNLTLLEQAAFEFVDRRCKSTVVAGLLGLRATRLGHVRAVGGVGLIVIVVETRIETGHAASWEIEPAVVQPRTTLGQPAWTDGGDAAKPGRWNSRTERPSMWLEPSEWVAVRLSLVVAGISLAISLPLAIVAALVH